MPSLTQDTIGRLSDRFFPESLVPGPFGKKEHLLVRPSLSYRHADDLR